MANPFTYLHLLPREVLNDIYQRKVDHEEYPDELDGAKVIRINKTFIRIKPSTMVVHKDEHQVVRVVLKSGAIEILEKRTGMLAFQTNSLSLQLNFLNKQYIQAVYQNEVKDGEPILDVIVK